MCCNIEINRWVIWKKVLIAYFLRGGGNYSVGFVKEGNTELVAELIQKETNGHLFKIESEHFYPNNYDECTRVCKSGKNANARPKLKQNIKDLNEYDIVYLGYPIWWSDFPMVVYSF